MSRTVEPPPRFTPPEHTRRTVAPLGQRYRPPVQHDEEQPPERWRWFGLGLIGAALAVVMLPGHFTWFLAAIPHEMGHATVACVLGHPAAPAISLKGEAWTGIAQLRPWLVWVMAAAAAAGAYALRTRPIACTSLGIAVLLIPLAAFTMAGDVLIVAGGHVGELAFATYCYTLAWTGGQTDTPQERVACAAAGGILQFVNLKLCFGLLTSAAARAKYGSNGSLGIKNDYLVMSEDLFGCSLGAVALIMFAIAMAPLPLGIVIGMWRDRTAEYA